MNSVLLFLVAASGFGIAVSTVYKYDLRANEIETLNLYLSYKIVKAVEIDINATFETYQALIEDCVALVNQTGQSCKTCATEKCGSSGGNPIDQILGAIDSGVSNIVNQVGTFSKDLFNNIGGTVQQFVGSAFSQIENQFNSIGSDISTGIEGFGNMFKGLEAVIGGIIASTEKILQQGLASAGQAFKDLGSYITDAVKSIENAFKSIPGIGKRSIRRAARISRELSQSCINKCPICKDVNLPTNSTLAQKEAAMAAVCSATYSEQVAAKTKLENLVNFVGYVANSTESGTPIISELHYNYDSGTRKETLLSFIINLPGISKDETGAAGTEMDSRNYGGLANITFPFVYTIT